VLTYTRQAPDGWAGHTGRIDSSLFPGDGDVSGLAFVCGTNGFVETAASLLIGAGYSPTRIRTERFGPTGR
jgi:ferredoxin-NADP reductase